jgi:dTDP-glucose 4,6-dehydratase
VAFVIEPLPPAADLEQLVNERADDFRNLSGGRILVTGGTGFVGSWLLASFAYANRRLALGAKLVALSRDPVSFERARPSIACDPSIALVRGDVCAPLPDLGTFDACIHAATATSAFPNDESPQAIVETVVDGTRRVLDALRPSGRIPFLFTSSGAVYGRQPPELEFVPEDYTGGPDTLNPRSAYHEAKRLAELLCAVHDERGAIEAKVARLFAFVGPYLPLNRNFAAGNFLRDALAGRDIVIAGDGTPIRSYLYAADMASWLWAILFRGQARRAYNVGSESALSIRALAEAVSAASGRNLTVVVRRVPAVSKAPERYVPSTRRALEELSLQPTADLGASLQRTLTWYHDR